VLSNDSDIEGDAFSIYSYTNPSHGSVSLDVATQSFTYSPNLNYNGSDSFTYTVAEDLDTSKKATGTVSIAISSVDDYPIIETDTPWIMYEDTTGTFDVDISDAETASANLLITFTSMDTTLIKSYNVVLQGSGTSRVVKLTPEAQMNGSLQLKVEVNDGALTTTKFIDIIIEPVNDPPVAQDYTATVAEDSSVSGQDVVKSDIDLLHEGDSHTYSLGTDGTHGTAVVALNGTWTYTPAANYNGTDQFTVIVTDSGGATATSTITVTVTKVNDTPQVTSTNSNVLDEDTSVTDTIVVYDPDLSDSTDPDSYTVQVITEPEHGDVVLDGTTGEYTYTPDANYNGTDSFEVKVVDEHDASTTKTVSLTVNPVNDAPVAGDDAATISEDGSATVSVLNNDTDVDLSREGDELTVAAVSGVDNGTATISDDKKTITFKPDADWYGSETFTYTVEDKNGATDTGDVTITVNAVNDAPVISDVADQTIDEDTNTGALSFTVTDVDNDASKLTVTAATSNGTIIPLSKDRFWRNRQHPYGYGDSGSQLQHMEQGYFHQQSVTITLTVSDGTLTDSDTFTVTVNPINDAPVAKNDTASVNEDSNVTISVLSNDTDVDISHEGDTITIQSFDGVDNGTVTIVNSNTQLKFVPNADYYGTEEFNYTIVDTHGATATAKVTVTVVPVNDPPVISDVANQSINEDSSTGALNFTVSDVDNAAESLTVTATTSNGTVIPTGSIVLGGSGTTRTVTVNPLANKNTWNKSTSTDQPVTITLKVSDGSLSASDTFTVAVAPVNDAPDAVNDTATVAEDGSVTISVLSNDTDVDISNEGDAITIASVADVDNGTVEISSDSTKLTFKPAHDSMAKRLSVIQSPIRKEPRTLPA
jgi:VCBS repeat-containing protein